MNESKQAFDSVWDAIEDDPVSAREMEELSDQMIALTEHIRRQGWTVQQAALRLDVSEQRMVALLEGQIGMFTREQLTAMYRAAGLRSSGV